MSFAAWTWTLLATAATLWLFAVYPVRALYKITTRKGMPFLAKAFWTGAVFVFGPLAAALFFLFFPVNRTSRPLAVMTLLMTAAVVAGSAMAMKHFSNVFAGQIREGAVTMVSNTAPNVSEANRNLLQSNLETLANELSTQPWYALGDRAFLIGLYYPLLRKAVEGPLQDNYIRFWNDLFAKRREIGWGDLLMQFAAWSIAFPAL